MISNVATGKSNVVGLVFVAAFAPDEGGTCRNPLVPPLAEFKSPLRHDLLHTRDQELAGLVRSRDCPPHMPKHSRPPQAADCSRTGHDATARAERRHGGVP